MQEKRGARTGKKGGNLADECFKHREVGAITECVESTCWGFGTLSAFK